MNGKNLKWFGIILIIVTGIVHFIEAPEYFEEAAYMGVLFVLNGIGSLAAAYGIYKRQNWGWLLGLLIAGGSIIGYALSRSVGLPGVAVKEWLEAIGILSLAVEGVFVILALKTLTAGSQTPRKNRLPNKNQRGTKNAANAAR